MVEPVSLSALALAYSTTTFDELFKSLAKKFSTGVAAKIAGQYDKVTTSFQPHLKATYERCTKLKTILKRDEPIDLIPHYVDLNFECGNNEFDNDGTITEIMRRKKAIIFGTGGTGKTIFMKYLWLSFFYQPGGRIPIFFELRRLNIAGELSLLDHIKQSLSDEHCKVSDAAFDGMVEDGKFIFMFDGFDEIHIEKRELVERQVLDLANANPNCVVVVSTRPDERLLAWQAFSVFKVQPLDQSQTIELIKKIEYQADIKEKFIQRIRGDLYDSHQSFLSSPLLATMMLMTFDQFADIPQKVCLFYEQAFETLFLRHDRVKEGFQRKMYTSYSMDVFKRYFSMFCLVSYFDEKFDFSEIELRSYLEKGFRMAENPDGDVDGLLKDLEHSVCIIQREGLMFAFTHRSFQEFFAAYALALVPSAKVRRILNRISARDSDSVVQMLFDLKQELVEVEFVLPFLAGLTKKLKGRASIERIFEFMRYMELSIKVTKTLTAEQPIYLIKSGENYDSLFFLGRLYPEMDELNFSGHNYRDLNVRAGALFFEQAEQADEIKYVKKSSYRSVLWVEEDEAGILSMFRTKVAKISSDDELPSGGRISLDREWLMSTGFMNFFAEAIKIMANLQNQIEQRRAQRDKTLDDVFGFG